MTGVVHPMPAPPWGATIAIYFVLAGAAAGATPAALWAGAHDEKDGLAVEWRASWLSFAALLVSCVLLVADLDQPARFFLMITEFSNFASVISAGAKLIALKIFLLALYLYLLAQLRLARRNGQSGEWKGPSLLLWRATRAALALASAGLAVYPAFLLARTWSSPLADGPAGGLLFFSTAAILGSGAAALLAFDLSPALRDRLARAAMWTAAAQAMVLLFAAIGAQGARPAVARAFSALTGAPTFWLLVLALGTALPCLLRSLAPGTRAADAGAPLAAVAGAVTLRWLLFSVS